MTDPPSAPHRAAIACGALIDQGPTCFFPLLLLLALAACGEEPRAERGELELTVSAAASLRGVMAELGTLYEARHPEVRIVNNFAGSGTLQRQVEHGAAVDVFVAAAERHLDDLSARELLEPDSRRVLASNRLVLVASRGAHGEVRALRDLAGLEGRVAIGAPASVPAGAYAREALAALGLWAAVEPRVVYAASVRQALTYAERGEVAAALVYATDAESSGGVAVVDTVPSAAHAPIRYVGAVVAGAPDPRAAHDYLAFLASAEARPVWRRHGFRAAPPLPS